MALQVQWGCNCQQSLLGRLPLLHVWKTICFKSQIQSSNMATYKPVTHVIFDMDGLLLDTQKLYAQTIREICLFYKKEMTPDLNEQCMGLESPDSAKIIVNKLNLPITAEEFYIEARRKSHALFMTSTDVMPDTEKIYLQVISGIASKYDKVYTQDVRMKVLGTMEKDTARIMVQELELPIAPEEFNVMQVTAQNLLLGDAELMPGAERLIRHLHKHGVPIAVATSSGEDSVIIKTANHKELFGLFNHMVMANSDPEVKKGKPNPDIFLICASRFPEQPSSSKCLVFEDAPNGVKAAVAARMQAVMVPDPATSEDRRKEATLVIDSLVNFKSEQFGLPPF